MPKVWFKPLLIPVLVLLALYAVAIYLDITKPKLAGRVMTPPQQQYKEDTDVGLTLNYLSRRWAVPLDTLYVLARHGGIEIGVLDSASLRSARVLVASPPSIEKLCKTGIARDGTICLANEIEPQGATELGIVRQFYATLTPSSGEKQQYAVIIGWDITPSGDGQIEALDDDGYVTVPVRSGAVLKAETYVAD